MVVVEVLQSSGRIWAAVKCIRRQNRYRILDNRVRTKIIGRLVEVNPQLSCRGAHGRCYLNAIGVVAVVIDAHQKGHQVLDRRIGVKR